MIPVEDADAVGLALRQVVGQVIADTGPEEGRDATHRWQMVLVHVVQHTVV